MRNILLDREGHIRLVDFGLTKDLSRQREDVRTTRTFCGTSTFYAPELIACAPPEEGTRHAKKGVGYGTAVDWWATGVLVYVMLCGRPPFKHSNKAILYDMICTTPFEVPPQQDQVTRDLLHQLLTKDPAKR
jgi:serine/threonine protein kinase